MSALIYPMFGMVLLTFVVLLLTLITRIRAVRSGLDARYFKTFSVGNPSDDVLKSSRHVSNLFEVPVLFYVGCLTAMQLSMGGFWIEFWAWFFVAARIAHAYVHLGRNKIYRRLGCFILGCLAVVAIWIVIILHVVDKPA